MGRLLLVVILFLCSLQIEAFADDAYRPCKSRPLWVDFPQYVTCRATTSSIPLHAYYPGVNGAIAGGDPSSYNHSLENAVPNAITVCRDDENLRGANNPSPGATVPASCQFVLTCSVTSTPAKIDPQYRAFANAIDNALACKYEWHEFGVAAVVLTASEGLGKRMADTIKIAFKCVLQLNCTSANQLGAPIDMDYTVIAPRPSYLGGMCPAAIDSAYLSSSLAYLRAKYAYSPSNPTGEHYCQRMSTEDLEIFEPDLKGVFGKN